MLYTTLYAPQKSGMEENSHSHWMMRSLEKADESALHISTSHYITRRCRSQRDHKGRTSARAPSKTYPAVAQEDSRAAAETYFAAVGAISTSLFGAAFFGAAFFGTYDPPIE